MGWTTGRSAASIPRLIATGISAFGDFGPRANYKAYEINAMHAGGMASLGPLCSPFPELPPLKIFGHQAEFQAGIHAAAVVMAAYWNRMKTGYGQAIEVSEQECIAAMLELGFVYYPYQGDETSRLGQVALAPRAIYNCADGKILIMAPEQAMWDRMVEMMGNPDWTNEELFKDRFARAAERRRPEHSWSSNGPRSARCRTCSTRRRPIGFRPRRSTRWRGLTPTSNWPPADSSCRFRTHDRKAPPILAPSAPFKSTAIGWTMRRPAPRLGEHNDEILRRPPSSAKRCHARRRRSRWPESGCWIFAGFGRGLTARCNWRIWAPK